MNDTRDSERDSSRIPGKEDIEKFERELSKLGYYEIGDLRYTGIWGHYDPTDARKSSWKVRQANRHLTERKAARERRLNWIAIGLAFVTGWIAIFVAALAIPLDQGHSVYCLLDPFDICVAPRAD